MSEVPLETLSANVPQGAFFFLFFLTLVTGPRRSVSSQLSDKAVYQVRARLGTTTPFCKVVVLKLSALSAPCARHDLIVFHPGGNPGAN